MIDFTINGKEYHSEKEVDFKAIYTMSSKMGLQVVNLGNEDPWELMVCLVSYFGGISKGKALNELNDHFKNGGKISDLEPLMEYFCKSDFFQKMQA